VIGHAVTPPDHVGMYREVVTQVRDSIALTEVADAQVAPGGSGPAKGFAMPRLGIDFPAPEGWVLQSLPEDVARQRGWAFGAHLKPAEGDSYILVGGRELPTTVGLDILQNAEMENVKAVVPQVTVQDQRDLKVSGFPARSWCYSMAVGQARQRREVFVVRKTLLVFIIADAIPPTAAPGLDTTVDALLRTMRLADM